jgi:hypothetical protein
MKQQVQGYYLQHQKKQEIEVFPDKEKKITHLQESLNCSVAGPLHHRLPVFQIILTHYKRVAVIIF